MQQQLVVVTGAASGIGEACAREFARQGATVVLADRDLFGAQRIATEIGGHAVFMDIGSEQSVKDGAAHILGKMGPVDILVNSAGVLQRTLPPSQLSMKEWDLVANVDLRGTYLCCAVFGTAMSERGGGAIVNIASVAGMRSGPLHSYGPAKAGVINLGECLAAEWGPKGIRVNTVSPGFTATPALQKGIANRTLETENMSRSTALGRLANSGEIAAAVFFLASPAASAITGVNLAVDCGYLVATPWVSYGGLRAS